MAWLGILACKVYSAGPMIPGVTPAAAGGPKEGLGGGNQLEMRSRGQGLVSLGGVRGTTQTRRGRTSVGPQAKERQGQRQPPEYQAPDWSGKTGFLLEPSVGAQWELSPAHTQIPLLFPRPVRACRAHSPQPRGGNSRTDKPADRSLGTAFRLASQHWASP